MKHTLEFIKKFKKIKGDSGQLKFTQDIFKQYSHTLDTQSNSYCSESQDYTVQRRLFKPLKQALNGLGLFGCNIRTQNFQ